MIAVTTKWQKTVSLEYGVINEPFWSLFHPYCNEITANPICLSKAVVLHYSDEVKRLQSGMSVAGWVVGIKKKERKVNYRQLRLAIQIL